MYIPYLPVIKTSRNQTPDDLNFTSGNDDFLSFESGRQGMRVGLDVFNFKRNEIVLMPASLCHAVIEPFSNIGMKIQLYSLNRNFQWNIDEIKESITSATVAIYVIHYFGITENLIELKRLCNTLNIVLIEDCALCGFDSRSAAGKHGDLVIFSLWKFHPIGDGAILKINNKSFPRKLDFKSPHYIRSFIRRVKIGIKSFLARGVMSINVFQKLKNGSIAVQNEEFDDNYGQTFSIYGMSKWAKKVFWDEDLTFCASQRISNFNALQEFCLQNGIVPLYQKITDGSVPYCFPIIVDTAISLQKALRNDGIETEISINKPLFGQSSIVSSGNSFKDIADLADRVLSIPVHQNIGFIQIEYIKNSLLKNLF